MKTYTGDRTIDGVQVMVDGAPLDPRFDLKTLSELGFEWGYEGAAPTQLALALAADVLGDDARALQVCEILMERVVANFANEWVMTEGDIKSALDDQLAGQ
jgi:hypothetical protein